MSSAAFTPYPKMAEDALVGSFSRDPRSHDHAPPPGTSARRSGARAASASGAAARWVVTEKVHGANLCLIVDAVRGTRARRRGDGAAAAGAASDPLVSESDAPAALTHRTPHWMTKDDLRVRFAKRTGILRDDEDFFGLRTSPLADHLIDAASTAFLALFASSEDDPEASGASESAGADTRAPQPRPAVGSELRVFGELFGGAYPHPDVPEDPVRASAGLAPVQSGIWYAPDLRFMAFDAAVVTASHVGGDEDGADAAGAGAGAGAGGGGVSSLPTSGSSRGGGARQSTATVRFLDFVSHTVPLLESSGFLVARPLCTGTLQQCMAFTLGFDSHIPAWLGLPALPAGSNKAEGVVVRSAAELVPSGHGADSAGSKKRGTRAMVKRKIAEFSEKKYDAARLRGTGGSGGDGGGGGAPTGPSRAQLLMWEADALLTEARIDAAASKVGALDASATPAVCSEVLSLVLDDIAEELSTAEGPIGDDGGGGGARAMWICLGLSETDARELRAHVRDAAKGMIARRVRAASKAARTRASGAS